jgi:hypothetical protein
MTWGVLGSDMHLGKAHEHGDATRHACALPEHAMLAITVCIRGWARSAMFDTDQVPQVMAEWQGMQEAAWMHGVWVSACVCWAALVR